MGEPKLRDAAEIERALAQYDAIEYLRGDDGDAVTILCPHLEAERREEQEAVECCGFFTDWETRRYYAPTVLEALQKAVADKKQVMEAFYKQANDDKSSCA